MNFTSEVFIFYFLPVAFLLFHILNRFSVKSALAWLSLSSLIFYAWEVPYYVAIILVSVLVDWIVSNSMVKTNSRQKRFFLLIVSLCSNLGLLGFFKYSGFIAQNIDSLGSALGVTLMGEGPKIFLGGIILPVGISFYTFQTLSYTIDIYDGRITKARSFIEFLAYVSSFPQLVAGPIVRYSQVSEQLKTPKVTNEDIQFGTSLFILGLAKKVLIADSLAPLAEMVFDQNVVTNGILTTVGVAAYGLQLYFDFSGYSEMAVGLGRFLGFRFPQNFNSPYKSPSMSEFWQRWHMTLSYWFRDYIYIKMGGSRCGAIQRTWNLVAAMTLCGFWHGAGWNFMFWGMGHGMALVVDKLFALKESRWLGIIRRIWCFVIVFLLWIPFRAESWEGAKRIFYQMGANFFQSGLVGQLKALPRDAQIAVLLLVPSIFTVLFMKNVYEMKKELTLIRSVLLSLLFIVSVYTLLSRDYIPFLYFQF